MKHLFTFFAFLLCFAGFSQRTANLDVKITSPVSPFAVDTNQTFTVDVMISNMGPDAITENDSLFFYIIIDNDTVQLPPQGNYEIYQNAIAPGASFTTSKTVAFNSSYEGSSITYCVAVHPHNAASPITDNEPANDKSCIAIEIGEQATTGLDEKDFISASVFPNPASGIVSVLVKDKIEALSILDISGKSVLQAVNGNNSIDCSQLPEGLYYLLVETKNGKALEKFAVQRN